MQFHAIHARVQPLHMLDQDRKDLFEPRNVVKQSSFSLMSRMWRRTRLSGPLSFAIAIPFLATTALSLQA
jgi:hypothetical protein